MIQDENFKSDLKGLKSVLLWVYEKLGERDEALELLSNESEVDNNEESVVEMLNIAQTQLRLGMCDEARSWFQKLFENDPQSLKVKAGYLTSLACTRSKLDYSILSELESMITISSINEQDYEKLPERVVESLDKQKRKSKKKKPLPKNYDPKATPDPGYF